MKKNEPIKKFPETERPYEKCETNGPSSLSDAELLAVILRTGTKGKSALTLAWDILYPEVQSQGLLNIHHATMEKLTDIKGVGKVKAIQIMCISELAKRLSKTDAEIGLSFHMPDTIAKYYMEEMRHNTQEVIKLLLLDGKTKLIDDINISKGTVNKSIISPREIYIEAMKREAVAIIILHNHPSGDPTPSKDDILITKRIKEAGLMLGISLLDHIVIGNNCYISFCEKGIL